MANPPTPGLVTALKIHNDARAAKKLAPLTWDDNLASQATDYAKHLASANKGLQHSTNRSNPPQGENLYAEMGLSTPPAAAAAQAWINEGAKWSEEMKIGEGDFGSYGHYTQCMWSSTTHVGMGIATAKNGWVFVVGRYSPPGNFVGSKPY